MLQYLWCASQSSLIPENSMLMLMILSTSKPTGCNRQRVQRLWSAGQAVPPHVLCVSCLPIVIVIACHLPPAQFSSPAGAQQWLSVLLVVLAFTAAGLTLLPKLQICPQMPESTELKAKPGVPADTEPCLLGSPGGGFLQTEKRKSPSSQFEFKSQIAAILEKQQ